ncbi:MAG: hypothetical protein [Microviridae sp.]|nr:MAG: hypothetical protein [Microviridae sp.]
MTSQSTNGPTWSCPRRLEHSTSVAPVASQKANGNKTNYTVQSNQTAKRKSKKQKSKKQNAKSNSANQQQNSKHQQPNKNKKTRPETGHQSRAQSTDLEPLGIKPSHSIACAPAPADNAQAQPQRAHYGALETNARRSAARATDRLGSDRKQHQRPQPRPTPATPLGDPRG